MGNRVESKSETISSESASNSAKKEASKTHQGRQYCCPCLTLNRILAVAAIVGGIILVLGLLALAGATVSHTGQYANFLAKIHQATLSIASKLATEPLTLAVFGVTTGGALFFGAGITLLIDYLRKREGRSANKEPHKQTADIYS